MRREITDTIMVSKKKSKDRPIKEWVVGHEVDFSEDHFIEIDPNNMVRAKTYRFKSKPVFGTDRVFVVTRWYDGSITIGEAKKFT